MNLDAKSLDRIIKDTISAIEESKKQVFDLAENTSIEYNRLKNELAEVKKQVTELLSEVDSLFIEEKRARSKLAEVSKNFNKYTETDIKKAYEAAQEKQIKLADLRGKESLLLYKRNTMEQSLRRLEDMLGKAQNLASQLSVVTNYLTGNLKDMSRKIDELQQVQQLGISIIKAQEEERRRLARDIHDGPAQLLANIVMRAEFCLKLLEVDPHKIAHELQALQYMVRQSLQDVRKIIFDLRPMVLDDLGLIPAIKRYIDDYQAQDGCPVELVVIGKHRRFSMTAEVALFRVIQECLNNIRKHARATHVLIKTELTDTRINMSIKDNGTGFDTEKVLNGDMKNCFGLVGIRERTQILNGELKISSSPGQGTLVNISIPITDQLE